MKKLTLTFCALFALVLVAGALYADGREKLSGKEKEVMQPAPPVCDFYRAHEWDLDIWGAYAFAADTGQNHFDTSTVRGENAELNLVADPFHPDADPLTVDIGTAFFGETQWDNPAPDRVNISQLSENHLLARADTMCGC